MASWGFLINYAGCCCASPTTRARACDVAARLDITERSAHASITDLTAAGYLVKHKGRPPQPLPDPGAPAPARTRQPGTHRRRSPGPPHGQRPARHRTAPG